MRQLSGARSSAPFVGRERELASLTERLRAPQPGSVDVLLIAGEPGVGKTRLMQEAAAIARDSGWLALLGHAYDAEGMPPYLPFIEALQDHIRRCPLAELVEQLGPGAADVALILPELRQRLPELPPSVQGDPQSDRYRLFESISAFAAAIARSGSGLLLCLDDLHWADDSTLLLIEHLARRASDAPLVILATYRDTDLDVARPFARTLEQFTRQRLSQRLDLKRLSKEGVIDMLSALGGADPPPALVESMYAETEGNPFFVQEVFEYLAEAGRLFDGDGAWRADLRVGETEVPQGVRLVIGRRLERLSEGCRRLLANAAVLGRSFSYDLLRTVPDSSTSPGQTVDEDALLEAVEEAERAHLLASDAGGQITFAHELVRQTLLGSLSAMRRQRMHLRAAEAIETVYADNRDSHLGELADHYLQSSGDAANLGKALQYAELAAQRAISIYAYAEAARFLERALEAQQLLDPDDKTRRCDLLTSLIPALASAGEPLRAAEREAEEALALAQDLGDAERASRVCLVAIGAVAAHGAAMAAITPLYKLWAGRLDRYAAPDSVARVHASLGLISAAPTVEQQLALRHQALALARSLGDRDAFLQAALINIIYFSPPALEREHFDLAREVAALSRRTRILFRTRGLSGCPASGCSSGAKGRKRRPRGEGSTRLWNSLTTPSWQIAWAT